MANQTKAQQWAERIAQWRASGLSARAYSVGRDFNHRDLYRWGHRLERVAAHPHSVQMVRLEPATASPPAATTLSAELTIDLGSARLAVPAGFDAATLRTVLEVLSSTSRGAKS